MAAQDDSLFGQESSRGSARPVECLGLTFASDEERRTHFTEQLREKLGDPDFRSIEGFPIGEDEDILALSDPPHYTACPNPWLADYIELYGRPYDPDSDGYEREPFAADVSEGKNDPIYNAHSYHTKAPHKAIMRYVLHYTKPGDIVFDGFCGTGMTGVAAQLCGDREVVRSLGYSLNDDGRIEDGLGNAISELGARRSVLSDLSPYASSIASGYASFRPEHFDLGSPLAEVLSAMGARLGDCYRTVSPVTGQSGVADFYVWSDVYQCPTCATQDTLYAFALDQSTLDLKATFPCPGCGTELQKTDLSRVWTTQFDPVSGEAQSLAKYELVEVSGRFPDGSTRYSATADDLLALSEVARTTKPWYPVSEFPHGRQTRKVKSGSGISRVDQMFTERALLAAALAWEQLDSVRPGRLQRAGRFLFTATVTLLSRRERYRQGSGKGAQSGTLYVPSLQVEKNPVGVLRRKAKALGKLRLRTEAAYAAISTQSHADLRTVPDDSVDYIFTDPPFGESLQYAELNFFHEAWLRVYTAGSFDCVMNYVHKKDIEFYSGMIGLSFREAARVLKPGRWMTVEFHNSQNSVWAAIQEALWASGLAVADVRVLDKRQSTYNVVNRAGAVQKDLVISAYKPRREVENRVREEGESPDSAWAFVGGHLKQLPVAAGTLTGLEIVAERQSYLLFDRMVAFHVQRGKRVPISATEFYQGLDQRFPCREGMYFLPEQVGVYDGRRLQAQEVRQLELFVTDEESAIQWLRRLLSDRPLTFQDIHPLFMREIAGWEKHEKALELAELLEESFIVYDGSGEVPSQVHTYLSSNFREMRGLDKNDSALRAKAKDRWFVPDPRKAGDLEQLRERTLLKEFDDYASGKGRLKVLRLEAVRAGFKRAWQEHDYQIIITVAERLPADVLQEDAKLLMWYDQALTRAGE